MSTIAFIGLGNMGAPMAANLIAADHTVVGFDVSTAGAEAAGVPVVSSAAEAVRDADVVITMLPSGDLVHAVYDEILPHVTSGALLIDSSTIAVEHAREVAERALAAGARPADAPVSGGVVGASAGTLAFMVGAAAADFEEIAALIDPMAGRVVHCGESGAGQATKICNNLMLAISMVGVSEAFVLGEKLGLTDQVIFDVTSVAAGQSWALTTNCPVPGPVPTSPANRDFKPGFASPLMAKDLGLAMQAAEATGTESTVGRLVQEIYRDFADHEGADLDFSAIIQRIRAASGG